MEQKITITEVHVTTHLELKVKTVGSININDMLSLEYVDNKYYFNPIEVNITDGCTTATLKERGYWADKLNNVKGINYKNLIGLNLSIITDEETIKQIEKESIYC